jgi:peptide deformylase
MTVRSVLRIGDPRLRRVAEPVQAFATAELAGLIHDLRDTMTALDGAGLAAPQIGVPLRVVIFCVNANPRYPQAPPIPETVLINPRITPLGPERSSGWEGCLSVPGMRGLVPRWERIRYEGVDADGTCLDRTVAGFHARVVQHECDHLDGVLYPDRIEDRRAFGFTAELEGAGVLPTLPAE